MSLSDVNPTANIPALFDHKERVIKTDKTYSIMFYDQIACSSVQRTICQSLPFHWPEAHIRDSMSLSAYLHSTHYSLIAYPF